MSRAYYNEFDRSKAAWLRELIKRNLIADGDVDERSIKDVRAEDLREYTQCHFFAGIGVWSHALRNAGWADDRQVWTGSCPCQGFSVAGKRRGFEDERHLWPDWFKLITECHPSVVFGEQSSSKGALSWLDLVQTNLETEDYAVGALDLCAAGIGTSHIRQRLYFVADANCERIRAQGCRTYEIAPKGAQDQVVQRERFRNDFRDDGGGPVGKLADTSSQGLHIRPSEKSDGPRAAWVQPERLWGVSELGDTRGERLEEWQSQQGNYGAQQSSVERASSKLKSLLSPNRAG